MNLSRLTLALFIAFSVAQFTSAQSIKGCIYYDVSTPGICLQCYNSLPNEDGSKCQAFPVDGFKPIPYCKAYYKSQLCAKCAIGYFNNNIACEPIPLPHCAEFDYDSHARAGQCLKCNSRHPQGATPGSPCGDDIVTDCIHGGWDYVKGANICKLCRGGKQSVNGVCTGKNYNEDGCVFSDGVTCVECDYQGGWYKNSFGGCAYGMP